jgi:dihydroorotate dehydrogenase (fumarate)
MDLSTRYLGLTLPCPIVASAGPLTGELANIRRLEDLGAGAVVMPSIFEEQIEHEHRLLETFDEFSANSNAEALTYFPPPQPYRIGPDRYLDVIHKAVAAVRIPVIASLNGTTDHGWIDYAQQIQAAGAHALELNIYMVPTEADVSGREVELRYLSVVKAVRHAVRIPVAVKISPYFSSMAHMAERFVDAGAAGLVLFNRFYQPEIDLLELTLTPDLELSTAKEIRLPLLWIGVLAGRIRASLAASTGVDTADQVIKYLLAGADVVMTTSALLKYGIGHMGTLVQGLKQWLASRDLDSLERVRGRLSQSNVSDPSAFARANYIRALQTYQPQR